MKATYPEYEQREDLLGYGVPLLGDPILQAPFPLPGLEKISKFLNFHGSKLLHLVQGVYQVCFDVRVLN